MNNIINKANKILDTIDTMTDSEVESQLTVIQSVPDATPQQDQIIEELRDSILQEAKRIKTKEYNTSYYINHKGSYHAMKCERCNYATIDKSNFTRHLKNCQKKYDKYQKLISDNVAKMNNKINLVKND